jgi:hypothetical protein
MEYRRVTSRRQGLVALLGLLLVFGLISVVFLLGRGDGCMSGNDSGSCPTLADVNGVRYGVGVAQDLVDIEGALTEYGLIARTNVPDYFFGRTAYSISGIDPALVLVAHNAVGQTTAGRYRFLFALDTNTDAAFPALCDYLLVESRQADPRCSAPA